MSDLLPLHVQTPLIRSLPMQSGRDCSIWLKFDALQPSGSFKLRGVGHVCQEYAKKGAIRLIASSGGNAGLAVAYAGRVLGLPVVVFVPETTTERAKSLLAMEGAEVIVHGSSWQEANALAMSNLTDRDAFIHPFDDPLLWHGHATMIDEVVASGVRPDAVVLSVGGGGLLCGVIEGLQRNGMGKVPVIAVETEGAASFNAAMKAGHPVALEKITTCATSLGAKQVCGQAVAYSKAHPTQSLLVTDRSALGACEKFLSDHRVLVEPACGASLAVIYDQRPELALFRNILVVVCGGATATIEQIRAWASGLN